MEKKNGFAFVILVTVFVAGVLAGSLYQVKIREQAEMYEYLRSGVSVYDVGIAGGIKAVCKDNMIELCALVLSVFLPFGIFLVAAILCLRGFLTGFALTAVLRTYGISGMSLCLGNIISTLIVIPGITMFGVFILNNYHIKSKIKMFVLCGVFLCGVFLCDGFLRGSLSVIMARLWR